MPFDKAGNWKPDGKKQEQFLALPESVKEAIIGGGVQTGKTELLLMYGVARRWHENPQFKQVYMRRELNQIRNEVVPRTKQIFGKLPGWDYNASYMYWTYKPVGSMIFLAHCEHEDDVHNWDTTEISLFTPDELTSFTEWMYLYIALERVRSPKGSSLPAITRGAAMPGDIGHTWVKKRFVDPAPEGNKIIVGKGGNKRVYVHATLADSENVDEDYAKQLDGLPEAERQAKKFGNWNSYQGQVFGELRDKRYPDEPENAVHVIDDFPIPDWWPKLFILDWGFAAMNYLLCGAVSPTKRVYIYNERWWVRTKIEQWAPYVKELMELDQPRIFKVCRSAKQNRGQEQTIQQQIETALETVVELTDNSPGTRVAGKLLLHEYLRWEQKYIPPSERPEYDETKALWLLRNRGIDEYKSYLKSLLPQQPETNLPKLQIFKSCIKLQDAIKACVYDKTNPEDVAEFNGDDPYDAIRYMLDEVEKYYVIAQKEFEKVQEQEKLIHEFEQTKDWNKIYRKAQINSPKMKGFGIRRYH